MDVASYCDELKLLHVWHTDDNIAIRIKIIESGMQVSGFYPGVHCTHICDALQQNREQVAQAYFEMWAIEVGIGVKWLICQLWDFRFLPN